MLSPLESAEAHHDPPKVFSILETDFRGFLPSGGLVKSARLLRNFGGFRRTQAEHGGLSLTAVESAKNVI